MSGRLTALGAGLGASADSGVGPGETNGDGDETRSPFSALAGVWIGIGVVSWAVTVALTTTPPLTGLTTVAWTVLAVVVLVAMSLSLAEPFRPLAPPVAIGALAVTLAGWTALVVRDDRWLVLTFALFALCFAKGRLVGLVLGVVVTVVWMVAWVIADVSAWQLLIPIGAFAAGAITSLGMYRVGDRNQAQAALIADLQATREELAASERERGTLEERARFAGEIHDTLAQGFTSIVLVSRATRRNGDWEAGLDTIETTAEENLQAARRLVAAMRPPELDDVSLVEALQNQLETLGDGIDGHLAVAGRPIPLDETIEVAMLRAAQEALLNVRTHSRADTVHVTVSYFDDTVALDVNDDGVGLSGAGATNRGSLTGGQGLRALGQRVRSLGGHLSVEAGPSGGVTVSVQLPARAP